MMILPPIGYLGGPAASFMAAMTYYWIGPNEIVIEEYQAFFGVCNGLGIGKIKMVDFDPRSSLIKAVSFDEAV